MVRHKIFSNAIVACPEPTREDELLIEGMPILNVNRIGKPLVEPIEYVNGIVLFSASLPLKNTHTTSLTIGLTAIAAKSVKVTVIPTLAYSKLLNPKWNLEILLPSHTQVRHIASERMYLLGGLKFWQTQPYLENNTFALFNDELEFTNSSVRAFFGVEKLIGKVIWFSAEAGYQHCMQSLISEPKQGVDDYLLKGNQIGNAYGRVGFFLRPMGKKRG